MSGASQQVSDTNRLEIIDRFSQFLIEIHRIEWELGGYIGQWNESATDVLDRFLLGDDDLWWE